MDSSIRALTVVCLLGATLVSHTHGDQFTWTGGAGSTVWADPANWVNVTPGGTATFPDADDNAAFYANHQVTIGAAANLTNSGTTWIGPGSVTVNDGVILNHGLLTYVGAATADDENLVINNSVLLTGAGTLQLVAGGDSFVRGNTNTTIDPLNLRDVLTNDVHHTIRGAGEIAVDLINRGTVAADVTNQILRLQGSLLNPLYAGSQNHGTINVTNRSQFIVNGARLDNRDGTINVAGLSTLNLTNGEISGGRILGGIGSQSELTGGGLLKDVALTGQWRRFATTLSGSITQDGVVSVGSGSGDFLAQIRISDVVTLRGNGELLLSGSIASVSTATNPPDLLINESGHTIRSGLGTVSSAINVDFINRGTIVSQSRFLPRAVPAGAVALSVGSTTSLGGNSINSGEIRVVSNASLTLSARRLDNSLGRIVLDNGANLLLGSGVLHGGSIVAGTGVGATLTPSFNASFLGDTLLSGSWTISNNPLILFGRITNNGNVSARNLTISRTVTLAGSGELGFGGATVPTVSSGGESTTFDPARILNTAGHTIRGNATFAVPIVNEARLQPGTMTINNLSLGSTSELVISPINLTQFGSIKPSNETSAMNLDGELIVDFQGNYIPGPRTFDILASAVISGDFTSLSIFATELPWVESATYEIIPNAIGALDVVRLTINNGVSGLAGDFNNDGFVDARDYTLWRDRPSGLTLVANDPTPLSFDAADRAVWAANFGRSWLGAPATPVPETRSVLIALVAIVAICRNGRRGG